MQLGCPSHHNCQTEEKTCTNEYASNFTGVGGAMPLTKLAQIRGKTVLIVSMQFLEI